MNTINLKSILKSNIKFIVAIVVMVAMVSCSGSGGDDVDDFTPPSGSNGGTNMTTDPGTGTNTDADAPAFSLKSLSGSDVKLSDYSNKVVVLFFFGNNCPSCKAVGPKVESQLATPFASRADYQILGLDQWNGNSNSVQAFKTSTNVSFPLLLNASGVAADYKTTYDRLVVINKAGKIVFSGKQNASSDVAAVNAKVKELLGN